MGLLRKLFTSRRSLLIVIIIIILCQAYFLYFNPHNSSKKSSSLDSDQTKSSSIESSSFSTHSDLNISPSTNQIADEYPRPLPDHLESTKWAPYIIKSCQDKSLPRSFAPCLLHHGIYAEELIYPDFDLRIPKFLNDEYKNEWLNRAMNYALDRYSIHKDWAMYKGQRGQNLVNILFYIYYYYYFFLLLFSFPPSESRFFLTRLEQNRNKSKNTKSLILIPFIIHDSLC